MKILVTRNFDPIADREYGGMEAEGKSRMEITFSQIMEPK